MRLALGDALDQFYLGAGERESLTLVSGGRNTCVLH